jgi:hypothetical protein
MVHEGSQGDQAKNGRPNKTNVCMNTYIHMNICTLWRVCSPASFSLTLLGMKFWTRVSLLRETGLPNDIFSYQKFQFGYICILDGKCWYILWLFGTFILNLMATCLVILYVFPHLGTLYQEKFGNSGLEMAWVLWHFSALSFIAILHIYHWIFVLWQLI